MKINQINYEVEENEKDNEDEKEEEEVEEEEKEKGESNEQQEEEKEGEEEDGEEGGEEVDEVNDEHRYDDYNHGKMIGNSFNMKERSKKIKMPNIKNISKNRPILKIIMWIVIIITAFIIILNIILAIARKKKKKKNLETNESNEEMKLLNNIDTDRFNKIKDYLFEQYNSNGEINLNKFQEESVNQKDYKTPNEGLTNIHISASLPENFTNEVITHLSSALYRLSSSSFLHVHLMSTDNFTLESFSRLINMVHKVNNNTEIIVYNAQQTLKDFKIREDKQCLFSKEYARLYALKAIKGVQKLIMLNIDNVMVEKDLNELYNIDMNDIYIRGITEVPYIRYKVDWMDNYLFDKSHFVNGDVLLVNLELSQKEEFYNKVIELNNNELYNKVEDPVQDLLNILMRKKIEFFHPKYNKINFYENQEEKNDEGKWYPWVTEAMKYSEKFNHFYTKGDLLSADEDPFIVNYVWEKQLGKKPKKYEEEKEMLNKLNGFSSS